MPLTRPTPTPLDAALAEAGALASELRTAAGLLRELGMDGAAKRLTSRASRAGVVIRNARIAQGLAERKA